MILAGCRLGAQSVTLGGARQRGFDPRDRRRGPFAAIGRSREALGIQFRRERAKRQRAVRVKAAENRCQRTRVTNRP